MKSNKPKLKSNNAKLKSNKPKLKSNKTKLKSNKIKLKSNKIKLKSNKIKLKSNETELKSNETDDLTNIEQVLDDIDIGSTNVQNECEEIKVDQYPSLQVAVSKSEYPEYKIHDADIKYAEQLMENDEVIFQVYNDWLLFCPFDAHSRKIKTNKIYSVVKNGDYWRCDKECIEECAKIYDNRMINDDTTPLCIHCMLAYLIIDEGNPMHLNVLKLDKGSLLHENPTIYFIKKCDSGQKRWIFGMDYLNIKYILWINNNGGLICKKHCNLTGCYHTKMLDEALQQYFGKRKYEIVRGKGDYERLVETGCSSYNPDKVHSKQSIPVPMTLLTKYDEDNRKSQKSQKYYAYVQNNNPPKTLKPEIKDQCEECKTDWKSMTKHKVDATYYDIHTASKVIVHYYVCPKCKTEYHMDGCMKHLFNYNDKIIITHELIIQLSLFITRGRCKTFTNFWGDLEDTYKIRGVDIKILDKSKLISCWKSCIQRFEWFPTLGCKLCDPQGTGRYRVVCGDGTYLVIKEKYAKNLYTPTLTYQSHNKEEVKITYLKSTRYITIPRMRRLWMRNICNIFGARRVDGNVKPLSNPKNENYNNFLNVKKIKLQKNFMILYINYLNLIKMML